MGNNVLILAMEDGCIVRWPLAEESPQGACMQGCVGRWVKANVSLSLCLSVSVIDPDKMFKSGCHINGVFIDPTGNHVLLSVESRSSAYSTWYLHSSRSSPKELKHIRVRGVAWRGGSGSVQCANVSWSVFPG
jgi:hypothetical protein